MRKELMSLLAVAVLSVSVTAGAASIEHDMKDMAGIYKSLDGAKSADQLHKMLGDLRAKAEDAKKGTPDKLEGKAPDSPEMKDFHKGMDDLIAQIDKADALAKQGKLDEAKAEAQKLAAIRNENHKKFR
ncbi:cytochrome b562 [Pantoea ananatis]|uniref:cytochrome b562 n=1 Tax=Pantoea ananas TaxID=553 RepID=UPI0007DACA50|nr:cytochrome b562 [Pantoea ananatis]UYL02134.1 cytochrome b562 [Pantoea ananatis]